MTRIRKQATTWRCPLADPEPPIPSIEDIRRLFEQLPADHVPDDAPAALPPPPADRHAETSPYCPQIHGPTVAAFHAARTRVHHGRRGAARVDTGGRHLRKKK